MANLHRHRRSWRWKPGQLPEHHPLHAGRCSRRPRAASRPGIYGGRGAQPGRHHHQPRVRSPRTPREPIHIGGVMVTNRRPRSPAVSRPPVPRPRVLLQRPRRPDRSVRPLPHRPRPRGGAARTGAREYIRDRGPRAGRPRGGRRGPPARATGGRGLPFGRRRLRCFDEIKAKLHEFGVDFDDAASREDTLHESSRGACHRRAGARLRVRRRRRSAQFGTTRTA